MRWRETNSPTTIPLWARCDNPFHLFVLHDGFPTGFSPHHRSQGWSVIRFRVSRSRTCVRKLQTQRLAKSLRLLRGPYAIVQASLL